MGEHKSNPTAALAKQGKLKPKKKPMSKKKRIQILENVVMERLRQDADFERVYEEIRKHEEERVQIILDNLHNKRLTMDELKPCEKHEFGLVHDCSECMNGAPYTFCCRIECGEHEFCRGCKFPKR